MTNNTILQQNPSDQHTDNSIVSGDTPNFSKDALIKGIDEFPQDWELVQLKGKNPKIAGEGWQTRPPIPHNEIKQAIRDDVATGVGLRTGFSGLIAIDIDGANGQAILDAILEQSGGELPETVSWTSGKPNRRQLLFRIPEDKRFVLGGFKRKNLTDWGDIEKVKGNDGKPEQLEIRFHNHQSVLPYSYHPDTKKAYMWFNDCSPENVDIAIAPDWVFKLAIGELKPPQKQPNSLNKTSDGNDKINKARTFLSKLNPARADDYDDWIHVGMMLKHTSKELLQDWINWSKKSDKFNEDKCHEKWKSFSGKNKDNDGKLLTIKSLKKWAEFDTFGESETNNISEADQIRALVNDYINASDNAEKIAIKSKLWSGFKVTKDDLNQLIDETQGIKKKVKKQVEILTAKDLFNGDDVGIKWLIPSLLPKGGVTILGADSGKGKTTLAYDCAGAVTFNEEFLGEKPSKQGKVLILSSDEPKAFAIDKLANRGFSEDDDFIFVPNWTTENWDVLEEAMADHNPDLIIIDSFNSIHSDEKFDANSDRAAITLNRLNEVLEEYDSACIMIHHLSKSKDNQGINKLRNSTAIAAASSMVWLMQGEGDILNFSLEKTRGTEPLNLKIKMDAPVGKFNVVEGAVYDDESKSLADRIEALFEEKYPNQRLEFEEIKAEITSNEDGLRKALGRLVKLSILNKSKSKNNKRKSVWYLPQDSLDNSPPRNSTCPTKAESPIHNESQTLDKHWTDIGQGQQDIGQTLDKDIGLDNETLSNSGLQTLDKDIGQNTGDGNCPNKSVQVVENKIDDKESSQSGCQVVEVVASEQLKEADNTSSNKRQVTPPPFQTLDDAKLAYLKAINSKASWHKTLWIFEKHSEQLLNTILTDNAQLSKCSENKTAWEYIVEKNYKQLYGERFPSECALSWETFDQIMNLFYLKAAKQETMEDEHLGIEVVEIKDDSGDFYFNYQTGRLARILTYNDISIWFDEGRFMYGDNKGTSIMYPNNYDNPEKRKNLVRQIKNCNSQAAEYELEEMDLGDLETIYYECRQDSIKEILFLEKSNDYSESDLQKKTLDELTKILDEILRFLDQFY